MNKNFLLILLLVPFMHTVHAQVFTDSNLPIILITTDNSAPIPDEPGVRGTMQIIYRGPGQRNYVTDKDSTQYLDYNGRIDIEIRGSSSQVVPKKGYGLSTIMADNVTNNNVSLLGMPDENDWILNGLDFDPSLIRDYLSYNLSRKIGQYASRTEFCEVMINGDYQGLYFLGEKIKPDKNRVNILKIEQGINTLPNISGGYITKTDKTTGNDPVAWSMSSYIGFNDNQFIHHWPKPASVTTQQGNYIKSVFLDLQAACTNSNASISTGYPSIIDIPSFVDFILINELGSNVDAYTFSTYYHKDRNGKLRAGPVWDMNLTYGNDLFTFGLDRSKPDVWQFSNGSLEGPKYYRDLFNNAQFKCYMSRRWNELTQTGQPLNLESLNAYIDSTVAIISEAVFRENARWGTVGSHLDAINGLKAWLAVRIPWMTNHLGSFTACEHVDTPPLVISRIHYHPDSTMAFPEEDKLEFLQITNAGISDIDLTGIYFGGTGLVYRFPVGSTLTAGTAILIASDTATFRTKYGVKPYAQFTRNLSNADQDIVLSDAFGNEIDHVHYYDDDPWPDADGNGEFLQLISTTLDNSLASSWVATGDITSATHAVAFDRSVEVYPNPTDGQLHIHSGQLIDVIEISDLQGRSIERFNVHTSDFDIDIAPFPQGMYFVRVVTMKNIWVESVFKH